MQLRPHPVLSAHGLEHKPQLQLHDGPFQGKTAGSPVSRTRMGISNPPPSPTYPATLSFFTMIGLPLSLFQLSGQMTTWQIHDSYRKCMQNIASVGPKSLPLIAVTQGPFMIWVVVVGRSSHLCTQTTKPPVTYSTVHCKISLGEEEFHASEWRSVSCLAQKFGVKKRFMLQSSGCGSWAADMHMVGMLIGCPFMSCFLWFPCLLQI